jgi:hypothetical protein
MAKTGKAAKGMAKTGKAAKGMPKTGKAAKGMAKTGKGAKGAANWSTGVMETNQDFLLQWPCNDVNLEGNPSILKRDAL